jgi:hypothetical protein
MIALCGPPTQRAVGEPKRASCDAGFPILMRGRSWAGLCWFRGTEVGVDHVIGHTISSGGPLPWSRPHFPEAGGGRAFKAGEAVMEIARTFGVDRATIYSPE